MRATLFLTPPFRRAALLCLAAGYVDAYGYVELGHVFAANMTGNTVLLGVALMERDWARGLSYALTLGAFFLGALGTNALKRVLDRAYPPLLLAAVLLVIAGRLDLGPDLVLLLLAIAMGLQGAALNRFGTTPLQTVVITSTLLNLADGCVHPEARPRMPLLGAAWLAYGVGAATSVLLSAHLGIPLVPPAAMLVLVAADFALSSRES